MKTLSAMDKKWWTSRVEDNLTQLNKLPGFQEVRKLIKRPAPDKEVAKHIIVFLRHMGCAATGNEFCDQEGYKKWLEAYNESVNKNRLKCRMGRSHPNSVSGNVKKKYVYQL